MNQNQSASDRTGKRRIFVTGATGFVGSAVVRELLHSGYHVIGLARSESSARALIALGAEAHRGDLEDLDNLRLGAGRAEGVIHTGFNHDFSKFKANCEADRRVIATLGSALAGSGHPLVITSAMAIAPRGQTVTEKTDPVSGPGAHPRAASEEAAAAVAASGVRASVVRLPPSVHGQGDHGFVPHLIALARETQLAAYPGEGGNRWPAVHRIDAARLYRLVLEHGEPGARYHAVAEEGVAFRAIAEVIGRRLGVPLRSVDAAGMTSHFGWFASFAAMDVPASNQLTRTQLDWTPQQPGLLADMDQADYFTAKS